MSLFIAQKVVYHQVLDERKHMTRDAFIALLMTYWSNGTEEIPLVRRGYFDFVGAAIRGYPGRPSGVHLHNPDERHQCPTCDTWEGALHLPGCDRERCGGCGRQLRSCDCQRTADTPRVPYIDWPNVCARCGELRPALFMVPNDEWERYIQKDMQRELLCQPCYETIKAWIDTGPQQPPPTRSTR